MHRPPALLGLALAVALACGARLDAQACVPPGSWPLPTALPGGVGVRYADVPYWDGTAETLDVYLPAGWSGSQALPTLLFVHGGGWSGGDKQDAGLVQVVRHLLTLGYPVVAPNYTRAGIDCQSGSFPTAVREVRAALEWIRRATDALPSGTDACLPPCVALVGSSAGGQLAALAGTVFGADDAGLFEPATFGGVSRRADLIVAISAPSDLYGLGLNGACPPLACHLPPYSGSFPDADACGALPGFPAGYPPLTPAEWQAAFGASGLPNGCWPPEAHLGCSFGAGGCPQAVPPGPLPTNGLTGNAFADASPLNWVDPGDTPFHLIHGECDGIVPAQQASALHDALVAAGVPVTYDLVASDGHGLAAANPVYPPLQLATAIDAAIQGWQSAGGCRAIAEVYGCGVNPFLSLTVVDGSPTIGTTLGLGLDNPLGTQGAPSIPVVVLAKLPAPNYPCGTLLPGFGMAGPSAAGELLVSLAPPTPVGGFRLGTPWTAPGSPAVVPIPIPPRASLAFRAFYAQGLLFDPAAAAGVRFGLTDAVLLVIGL